MLRRNLLILSGVAAATTLLAACSDSVDLPRAGLKS